MKTPLKNSAYSLQSNVLYKQYLYKIQVLNAKQRKKVIRSKKQKKPLKKGLALKQH